MQQDKAMHLILGSFWLAVVWANIAVFSAFGLGPALAFGTTVYGVIYEANQWYRKEGKVEVWDAVATSAPGWFAWLILVLL